MIFSVMSLYISLANALGRQDVSMVDLTVATDRPSSLDEIMDIFRRAASSSMAGVLQVSDQDLVSSDLLGTSFSAVVDSKASLELNSQVTSPSKILLGLRQTLIHKQFFKIIAWYDNEWGYSTRLLDLVALLHKQETTMMG
jgi:glyceraldehyde 3-phosphate dehydrogenase